MSSFFVYEDNYIRKGTKKQKKSDFFSFLS
nr:MAG TPA: hypothetical protein [Caudoviricetes sp.]